MGFSAARFARAFGLEKFFRGEGPESGAVRLAGRRVYILPTREGLAYAFAVLVVLLGSLNYQSSLGYMFSFTLAAMGLVSMLWTQRNLVGLIVLIEDGTPVFAGEAALFRASLESGGRARWSVALAPSEGAGGVTDTDAAPVSLAISRAGLTRGVRQLGRVTVETRYPLGLFRAWAVIDSAATAIVYPKPVYPRLKRMELVEEAGGEPSHSGAKKGGAEDFWGLREYVSGDMISRIHWKALARAGALTVKEFELPEPSAYNLDYDALGMVEPERKLSILCGMVIEADRAGAPYALSLPSRRLGPGRGAAHKAACLDALARFEP